jgi:hypothetical protein
MSNDPGAPDYTEEMERWLSLATIDGNLRYARRKHKISDEELINLAAFGFACLNIVPTHNQIGAELNVSNEALKFIADEIWQDFSTPED